MTKLSAIASLVAIAAVMMTSAQGTRATRFRTTHELTANVESASSSGGNPSEALDSSSDDLLDDFADDDNLNADLWSESAAASDTGDRFLAAVDSSDSSGSEESESATAAPLAEPGHQFASVSGGQACGGQGFNYARYWRGALPEGDATTLECVAGFRCEAKGSSPYLWCQQYAIPPYGQCAGFRFYTWFQCIEGTTCTLVDSSSAKCIPRS